MGKLIMGFYLLLSPDIVPPLYLQFVTFLTFENTSNFFFRYKSLFQFREKLSFIWSKLSAENPKA